MDWLIVLLLCLGNSRAQLSSVTDTHNTDLEEGLLSLLLRFQQEESYETLLVYGEECVFHSLSRRLEVPKVLVSVGSTEFDWAFSSRALVLSCDPEAEKERTKRTLFKLQNNRRLIFLPQKSQPDSVCERYAEKEQYNVAMVREDFAKSKVIYACRSFQNAKLKEVSLMESEPIYIDQFRNMHGKPITAMTDLLAPRTMQYQDPRSGEMKLTGCLGNLFNNYVQKVNATLQFEVYRGDDFNEIIRRVKADELDMGIHLVVSIFSSGLDTASYPFLLTSYCLMLQVPAQLPVNMVYAMIVDRMVLLIIFVMFCLLSMLLVYSENMSWRSLTLSTILLNDISLRGLLGQSHPFPLNASRSFRMIFCILCFASIMMTTMYNAYLQSFFTDPPTKAPIKSFKDLDKLPQKIAISAFEVAAFTKGNNSHFKEVNQDYLEIFDNWQEYVYVREMLNLSYSYVSSGDRWTSIVEQQKIFKRPAFYFATDLCFSRLMFLSIPLRKHLPYRHLFEEHILRQHEFGLVNHWMGNSFLDKVRLGITPFKDLSPPTRQEASLVLEDISWLLNLYVVSMVLSIFCFLVEVFTKSEKWRRWRGVSDSS